RASLTAERRFLAALGGTCHSAIAVYTTHHGADLQLNAALFSPDGKSRIAGEIRFPNTDLTAPATLAARLLSQSPPSITDHFTRIS
ncbi:MAG: hydroxymethylbilane synthase, partial [Pseudomonadota bacterium]